MSRITESFIPIAVVSRAKAISSALGIALESEYRCRMVARGADLRSVQTILDATESVVVLIDASDAATLRELRACNAPLDAKNVVAFGVCDGAPELRFCAHLGARAILDRDATLEELASAISLVARGDSYISPRLSAAFLRELAVNPDNEAMALTVREREVARLLAANSTYAEIGKTLRVSANTVKNHAHSIYRKCGVRDRYHLAERMPFLPDH